MVRLIVLLGLVTGAVVLLGLVIGAVMPVMSGEALTIQSLKIESKQSWEIADLVFYNEKGPMAYTPQSEWLAVEQTRVPTFNLFDGNEETVATGKRLAISAEYHPQVAHGIIVRGVKLQKGADTRIDLVGFRAKPILSIPLAELDDPHATYRYDFAKRAFEKLTSFPELASYTHPITDLRTRPVLRRLDADALMGDGASETGTWTVEEDALVLRQTKGQKNRKKNSGSFPIDHTLKLGETLTFFFNPGMEQYKSQSLHTFVIGKHRFVLKNRQFFIDANGTEWIVRTNFAAYPCEFAVSFTRTATGIDWAVIGPQFDRSGTCEGVISDEEFLLSFEFSNEYMYTWWNDKDSFIDELRLTQLDWTESPPPAVPTAAAKPIYDPEKYQGRIWRLLQLKPDVAPLVMKRKYGQVSDEELSEFKRMAKEMIVPKTNVGNGLTFGAGHDLRSIVDVLRMRYDPELLDLVVTWTDSILAHRNGGKSGSFNILPAENWNAETIPTRLDFIAPIWPHFMGPIFQNGQLYITQDLTSGASGMAALMYYAAYIADHPERWDEVVTLSDGEELSHRALAIRYVEKVEETLDTFMIPYFIDPDTLRIERPWNRYTQLIEACHYLKDVYAVFGEELPDAVERADYCDRVVRAYLAYFFDAKENYTVSTVKVDGEEVAVARTEYAPLWRKWGSTQGEDLGHGTMEYGDFFYFFLSGEYSEYLTPAQLRIFSDNFHHRMYRGYNEDRRLLICDKYSGLGRLAGIWISRPIHIWTGIMRPELYDELMDAFINATSFQIDLQDYSMILKIREQMWQLGYRGEGKSIAPSISISVEKQHVKVGQRISFKGNPFNCTDWEWDFDQDGTIDAKDVSSAMFTFKKPGIYVVSVKGTDPKTGISGYGFKTIIVE